MDDKTKRTLGSTERSQDEYEMVIDRLSSKWSQKMLHSKYLN